MPPWSREGVRIEGLWVVKYSLEGLFRKNYLKTLCFVSKVNINMY